MKDAAVTLTSTEKGILKCLTGINGLDEITFGSFKVSEKE